MTSLFITIAAQKDIPKTVEKTLISAERLLREDVNSAKDILAADGHKLLLELMKTYLLSIGIQLQICKIIGNLACYSEQELLENDTLLLILLCMQNHDSHELLRYAFVAIANLTSQEKGQIQMLKLGGIEIILDTMQKQIDQPRVQAEACLALGNLAFQEPIRKKIAELTGIELIIKLIQTHPTDPRVNSHACFALGNMCEHRGSKEKMKGLNLLKHLQYIKKNFQITEK